MEDYDFVKAFFYFSINHIHDDFVHSYYDVRNDDGRQRSFTFTTTSRQMAYVQADFYDSRMYAPGCKTTSNFAKGTLILYRGNTVVSRTTFND